jgi:hypothetical protein
MGRTGQATDRPWFMNGALPIRLGCACGLGAVRYRQRKARGEARSVPLPMMVCIRPEVWTGGVGARYPFGPATVALDPDPRRGDASDSGFPFVTGAAERRARRKAPQARPGGTTAPGDGTHSPYPTMGRTQGACALDQVGPLQVKVGGTSSRRWDAPKAP